MKSKKLKVGAVAMALVFAMSGSAFAAGGPTPDYPGTTGDQEYQTNADTTISVMSSSQNAGNMSYTVPLYVTMAVSNGQEYASVPSNYGIMNTSIQGPKSGSTTGEKDKMDIGVTGIRFDKISDDSGYRTVETDPADNMDINLMIGGVQMPALSHAGTTTVSAVAMCAAPTGKYPPTKDYGTLSGAAITNVFQTAPNTGVPGPANLPTYKAISVDNTVYSVPIVAKIAKADNRVDAKAAAQFRVRYDVSLLDPSGKPLGDVYAGSNYHQAGLDNAPEK